MPILVSAFILSRSFNFTETFPGMFDTFDFSLKMTRTVSDYYNDSHRSCSGILHGYHATYV